MFHTRTCTHCRLPSELPWESLPPPDPSLIKKIKTLDIISHKCGFEASSVTRHVPQSALAPDSWRGLLEDQNDFMPPPTYRGLPKVLGAGRGAGAQEQTAPSSPRCHRALHPTGWVLAWGTTDEKLSQRLSLWARARQLVWAPVPERFMRADPLHRAPGAG